MSRRYFTEGKWTKKINGEKKGIRDALNEEGHPEQESRAKIAAVEKAYQAEAGSPDVEAIKGRVWS